MKRDERQEVSAADLLWRGFTQTWWVVSFTAGASLSVTLSKVSGVVPIWVFVLSLVVSFMVIVGLANSFRLSVGVALRIMKAPRKIEVLSCKPPSGPYVEDAYAVFEVRTPDGIPTDATVAFFRQTGEGRQHIGFGTVRDQLDKETYEVPLVRLYPDIVMEELFDRNKVGILSARLEISLGKADRSKVLDVSQATGNKGTP